MERISKAEHFCIPLPSVYEKFLHILILPETMICYCTAPIWRRGRKDQSWKWPQMGAFFPHQPRFSDGKKVLNNMCVYTNDALKIITVVIIFSDCNHDRSVPNVGVALRQIASSISVPTSNKSPISLLYCNCIQMIWWSDDDADDFNALGA